MSILNKEKNKPADLINIMTTDIIQQLFFNGFLMGINTYKWLSRMKILIKFVLFFSGRG